MAAKTLQQLTAQGTPQDADLVPTTRSTGALSSTQFSDVVTYLKTALAGFFLKASNNLSDVADAPTSRINLGLGTAATHAATDFLQTGVANTFTQTQTFDGSVSALAAVLANAAEVGLVSATAATGTVNFYVSSQSVLLFTSNAAANWTTNITLGSGHTLDSVMSVGQSINVAFGVTQGATPYFCNTVQIDGTTTGVTTKWLGAAPVAGTASGVDWYSFTVIKTGSATFAVFASQAGWT
jgi:hypothetical protein